MKKIGLLVTIVTLSLSIYCQTNKIEYDTLPCFYDCTYSVETTTYKGYTYSYGKESKCNDCTVYMDVNPFDSTVSLYSDEAFSLKFKYDKLSSKGATTIYGKNDRYGFIRVTYGNILECHFLEYKDGDVKSDEYKSSYIQTSYLQKRRFTKKEKPYGRIKVKRVKENLADFNSNPFEKTVNYFEKVVNNRLSPEDVKTSLKTRYNVFKENNGLIAFLKRGGHTMNKVDMFYYTETNAGIGINYVEMNTYKNSEKYSRKNLSEKGYELTKNLAVGSLKKEIYRNPINNAVIRVKYKNNSIEVEMMYFTDEQASIVFANQI